MKVLCWFGEQHPDRSFEASSSWTTAKFSGVPSTAKSTLPVTVCTQTSETICVDTVDNVEGFLGQWSFHDKINFQRSVNIGFAVSYWLDCNNAQSRCRDVVGMELCWRRSNSTTRWRARQGPENAQLFCDLAVTVTHGRWIGDLLRYRNARHGHPLQAMRRKRGSVPILPESNSSPIASLLNFLCTFFWYFFLNVCVFLLFLTQICLRWFLLWINIVVEVINIIVEVTPGNV